MRFFERGKERPPDEDPMARLRRYTTPESTPPAMPREDDVYAAPDAELEALAAKGRDDVQASGRVESANPSESTQEILVDILDQVTFGRVADVDQAPAATAPLVDLDDLAAPPAAATAPPSPPAPRVPAAAVPPRTEHFVPPLPESVEATGLSRAFLADHIIRTIYFTGELTGAAVADQLGLPFPTVVQGLLEQLRREGALEVRGQRGLGDGGYIYVLTEKGVVRAHEAMKKLQYRGPAPVPFEDYCRSVRAQANRQVTVTQENIREAFKDLLIHDSVLEEVGPAVNSGSSMFLFGYPGNGKTSIAERITRLMGQSIYIPYAVEVDGEIIKVFDSTMHQPKEREAGARLGHDRRWVEIERPTVVVGGELTMAGLDLLYNEAGGYYEAPLQMKANGGMFLIDDFGRQLVRPTDLLNRWIVPLEKRFDYLTLITGKKIQMPFEELIVFSTNLDPSDLVDEAFLRRIKFKINVVDPDENQFREIFKMVARARGIPFDEDGFQYLLDHHYRDVGRPLRMCQPRDLLDQLIAIARYKMLEPAMTPELIDRAASTYFVTMSQN